jgi:hypothetical protein
MILIHWYLYRLAFFPFANFSVFAKKKTVIGTRESGEETFSHTQKVAIQSATRATGRYNRVMPTLEHPSTRRQREALEQIHLKYGPRCNICGYDNDVRALQIDHVQGGGSAEIRGGNGAGIAYYLRVLKDDTGRYQLLCANCNKIKRHENKEAQGVLQHKRRNSRRPQL